MPVILPASPSKHFLVASDFDQTLSFNDSGAVLGELLGATGFEQKVAGQEITVGPARAAKGQIIDLMDALKASLAAKSAEPEKAVASAGGGRRPARAKGAAATGTERARNWKRLQFPKVTVQFGEPLQFEQVAEPTKEQAQAASEIVFERVREMHSRLVGEGRKSAVRAARENRRAAAA